MRRSAAKRRQQILEQIGWRWAEEGGGAERLREMIDEAETAERVARRRRYIPPHVRRRILSGPCTYCGGWSSCVDHVVPVARGGTSIVENLTAACDRCNSQKLDWLPFEWRQWREAEGLGWPPVPVEVELAGLLRDRVPPLEREEPPGS